MSPILGGPGDMSPLRHFQLSFLAHNLATKKELVTFKGMEIFH
jgi:hypothetical protein